MSKTLGLEDIGKYAYLRDGRVAFIENVKHIATRSYKRYDRIITMKTADEKIHDYYSRVGMNQNNGNLDIIQIWSKDLYNIVRL